MGRPGTISGHFFFRALTLDKMDPALKDFLKIFAQDPIILLTICRTENMTNPTPHSGLSGQPEQNDQHVKENEVIRSIPVS